MEYKSLLRNFANLDDAQKLCEHFRDTVRAFMPGMDIYESEGQMALPVLWYNAETGTHELGETIAVRLIYLVGKFGEPNARLYSYGFNPCEEPFNVACVKFRDSLIYPANA